MNYLRNTIILVCAVCFILSPNLQTIFPSVELEEFLILLAGLTNFVAVVDISKYLLNESCPRLALYLLPIQLLVLIALIGLDINLAFGIMNEEMGASIQNYVQYILIALFLLVYLMWYSTSSVTLKKYAPHIMFLAFILFVVILFIDNVHVPLDFFAKDTADHIQKRYYSLLHLLGIPLMYCIFDSALKESRYLLVIDFSMLITGVAIFRLGFVADMPLFEAGGAATILLLGNAWYNFLRHD